jgi:hypothetical protein
MLLKFGLKKEKMSILLLSDMGKITACKMFFNILVKHLIFIMHLY